VPHGSSFITAVQFTDGDCPVDARTFVTYGQSENPRSPHANDYTKAFSRRDWHEVPYCKEEISSDPNLEEDRIEGTLPGGTRDSGGGRSGSGLEAGGGEGSGASGGAGRLAATAVGGTTASRDVPSSGAGDGRLPFTGLALGALVLLGLALLGTAVPLRRRARATSRNP
jgi:Penicillin amidase